MKKKYGDGTKISADPVGKVFMVFYDKISAAGEMECSVYLYQNKLASVSVNYEDDENAQNIDVLFLGGDFRTQNMKIAFLTGRKRQRFRQILAETLQQRTEQLRLNRMIRTV